MSCVKVLLAIVFIYGQIAEGYSKSDSPEIHLLNVDKVRRKGLTGKGIVVAVVDDGVNEGCDDLKYNYNADLSFDFVNSTTTRQARSHGTRCAGVLAGKHHGECRNEGGIAYNAQLADLKILNGTLAHDKPTAKALGYKKHQIDIYSNSWGPADNGRLVHGPGPMVKDALKKGVEKGRHGRGSIFVFASGNGGGYQDSCAFDGYINNIYTIAIGAVTKFRKTPYYAEPCSSVMAAAYGDDVKTCDLTGCVNNFGRTSAAGAMASGIIALLLEATNNTLTWRDVHHLIVRTSTPNQEVNDGKGWIVNGAGLMVHPFLGFGIMDANRLVEVATKNWQTVPDQKSCTIKFKLTKPLTFDRRQYSFVIDTNLNENCSKINHIEQVQVEFSLSFKRRGLLHMYLESPLTTKSKLIYERVYDAFARRETFNNLPVTSLHFWGESVKAKGGIWKIWFESSLDSFKKGRTKGKLSKFKVTFYGTEEDPIRNSGLTKDVTFCEYKNKTTMFWAGYGKSCCGAFGVYDENRAKCCNHQTIIQNDLVCGRRKFDMCTQMCCDGKVHKKAAGTICCGQETYNIKTQICCKKRPVAKFKCKRVWQWYPYYLGNAEAVCPPSSKLYYRLKKDESCLDPCADNPCKNGGQCSGNIKKYMFTCRCVQGYRGETCEEKVRTTACTDNSGKQNCERWKRNYSYCKQRGSEYFCQKTCGRC